MRTRASTYLTPEAAQRFVQAVVDANEMVIGRWLAHGTAERLKLEGYWPHEVTGRVQLAGMMYAGRGPVDAHGVRVVLKRSDRTAHGFVVLTSFPTLA